MVGSAPCEATVRHAVDAHPSQASWEERNAKADSDEVERRREVRGFRAHARRRHPRHEPERLTSRLSRPTVVAVRMPRLLRIVGSANSAHIDGTLAPGEEPSTASGADIPSLSGAHATDITLHSQRV